MLQKYASLFFVLLFFIIGYPFLEQAGNIENSYLVLFGTIVPVITMYAAGSSHKRLEIMLSAGVPYVLSMWMYAASGGLFWLYSSLFLTIVFYILATGIFLHRIHASKKIDTTALFSAVNVYLLVGIAWSIVYDGLEKIIPASFVGTFTWSDFLYYSFSTLTTLGHGDIVPVMPVARMLTYVQAVFGVLFVAILVAKVMGAHSSHALEEAVKQYPPKVIRRRRRTTTRKKTTTKKTTRKTTKKKSDTTEV